ARAGASFFCGKTLIVRPVSNFPCRSMLSFVMKMPRTSLRSSSLKNQPSGTRNAALIDATFFHLNPGGAAGRSSEGADDAAARTIAAAARSVRISVLRRDQLIDPTPHVGVGPAHRALDAEEDTAALVHDVGLGILRAPEPVRGRRVGVVV